MKLTKNYSKTLLFVLFLTSVISCQKNDTIVQSLFDLSGAPLKYDDSNASKHLNVAAVSIKCSKDKSKNIEKIKQRATQAKVLYPKTELILFGESVLGWYIDDDNPKPYQEQIAESIPGPATDSISKIAFNLGCYIGFGLTEKNGDNLYNSFVLINPDGEIEAIHRKVNITPEDELGGIIPASKVDSSVTIVEINNIKAAMIICADVNGFWLSEKLISNNVELILHPMASEVPMFKIDAVSRQFNAWEVFANRYGSELERSYSGTCFIADPAGTIRVGGSENEGFYYYKIGVK
jgi:N-carbamoylputrescine amidase